MSASVWNKRTKGLLQTSKAMQEAGARNRKGDRARLVQIIVAAFDNMSAGEQDNVLKELRSKLKAKKTGGKK